MSNEANKPIVLPVKLDIVGGAFDLRDAINIAYKVLEASGAESVSFDANGHTFTAEKGLTPKDLYELYLMNATSFTSWRTGATIPHPETVIEK